MTIRVGERESSKTSDVEIRASSERAGTVDGDVPAVVVGTLECISSECSLDGVGRVDRVGKDIRRGFYNQNALL